MLLVVVGLFMWLGHGRNPQDRDRRGTELAAVGNKDYALWSRTVIGGSAEARHMKAVPARAQERGPDETTVWAAPGTNWQIQPGPRIELTAGELFVRIPPPDCRRKDVLEVHASTTTAKTSHAAFFIELRKPRPGERKGRVARQRLEALVSVTILNGQVQVDTPKGTIMGYRGEMLTAPANGKPRKHVVAPERLPKPPR
jgi:hypothetical protein